jgi:hypothetical protein
LKAFLIPSSAVFALAVCFIATESQACGEVMFRTSSTLRYHSFTTRHPAAILLYVDKTPLRSTSTKDAKLHDQLERAGHKVIVARGSDELAHALALRHFDVVITNGSEIDGILSQIVDSSHDPILIPMVDRDAKNAREIRERFSGAINDDADLNDFLKVIEQSMKARGA